jgi:hypothetical protein
MWVNKYQWNRVMERLEALERWKSYHEGDGQIIVYQPEATQLWHLSMSYSPPHAKIAVADVVRRILDHLGIKLRYEKGNPERVAIDIPPTAASLHPQEKP